MNKEDTKLVTGLAVIPLLSLVLIMSLFTIDDESWTKLNEEGSCYNHETTVNHFWFRNEDTEYTRYCIISDEPTDEWQEPYGGCDEAALYPRSDGYRECVKHGRLP